MDAIKGGDIVGVGGAVCVVPETCCECAEPAVKFEGFGHGRYAEVRGWCATHAAQREREAEWRMRAE